MWIINPSTNIWQGLSVSFFSLYNVASLTQIHCIWTPNRVWRGMALLLFLSVLYYIWDRHRNCLADPLKTYSYVFNGVIIASFLYQYKIIHVVPAHDSNRIACTISDVSYDLNRFFFVRVFLLEYFSFFDLGKQKKWRKICCEGFCLTVNIQMWV